MVEIKNLSKHFFVKRETIKAVDNLSLRVEEGEIYGLLGANGAGKTTTMRTLATALSPTSGTADIYGMDLSRDAERVRPLIGLLFGGDVGLYDKLTAKENILYFAELNGVDKDEALERIDGFAKSFAFTEYLDKPVGTLSKGTRQKVAFSRAIAHNPSVMLYDEPTAGLDVTARRDVQEFIMRCRDEGKCIILSDHVLSTIERLCGRVGIMKSGTLLGEGSIPELCARYECENLEQVFFKLAGERSAE